MATAHNSALLGTNELPESMPRGHFLECLRLVERLHRRLLDILKLRLDQTGRTDINSVQALLLYNVGEHEMTAGELRTRGYYLGSNVSYNLKKLVEMGYIEHERSEHDRRAVRIRLSDKGREVSELISLLYDEQLVALMDSGLLGEEEIKRMRNSLRNLERFWAEQVGFSVI